METIIKKALERSQSEGERYTFWGLDGELNEELEIIKELNSKLSKRKFRGTILFSSKDIGSISISKDE